METREKENHSLRAVSRATTQSKLEPGQISTPAAAEMVGAVGITVVYNKVPLSQRHDQIDGHNHLPASPVEAHPARDCSRTACLGSRLVDEPAASGDAEVLVAGAGFPASQRYPGTPPMVMPLSACPTPYCLPPSCTCIVQSHGYNYIQVQVSTCLPVRLWPLPSIPQPPPLCQTCTFLALLCSHRVAHPFPQTVTTQSRTHNILTVHSLYLPHTCLTSDVLHTSSTTGMHPFALADSRASSSSSSSSASPHRLLRLCFDSTSARIPYQHERLPLNPSPAVDCIRIYAQTPPYSTAQHSLFPLPELCPVCPATSHSLASRLVLSPDTPACLFSISALALCTSTEPS